MSDTEAAEPLAFIGLGQMGAAMAGNLLKAGHRLSVWNRSPDKSYALAGGGVTVAESPAATLASGAKVVLTMLTDDSAVHAVVFGDHGIAPRLGPGVTHVSMSTTAPATAETLADDHRRRGAGFVAAPVFGKPDAAAAAKLVICTSGSADARARVAPVLARLGHRVTDFGDNPAAAPAIKLAGNFMIGAAIEAMAEAFTLAEKTGVPRQQIYELFAATLFACPIYQNYGRMIAAHDYQPPGAPPSLIRKDMRLVLEHAGRQMVPMPLAGLVYDRLTATVARQSAEQAAGGKRFDTDWTAFAAEVSRAAGLTVPAAGE